MGHGLSAEASLSIDPSARMKRIPAYLLPTVMRIAKDAAYEMYDLIKSYHDDVYPPHADVINGRCEHRILRKGSWVESDVYEEIELAIANAREERKK